MRTRTGSQAGRHWLARMLGGALLLWAAAAAHSQPGSTGAAAAEQGEGRYIRVTRDTAGNVLSLQTAIASFGAADNSRSGIQVDLVAAVHIADAGYYDALNRRFQDYDSVLYELVAPEGTRVPADGRARGGILTGTQVAMTQLLDLTFQLDGIDYSPANFVHADLSPQEVAQSMAERGESVSQYLVKMFALAMSEQARDPYGLQDIGLLAALFSPDRARLLKSQFAVAMLDMESLAFVIEGDEGSTLVGERNKRAVAVLEERIGRGDRHVAIFYGAAHMPDMAMQLESRLGLRRKSLVWLDAWDLR
jgi:hypothetical protein